MDELAAPLLGRREGLLDGITVQYPDWWFNVRPSNTEPFLRLVLEAKDEAQLAAKRAELEASSATRSSTRAHPGRGWRPAVALPSRLPPQAPDRSFAADSAIFRNPCSRARSSTVSARVRTLAAGLPARPRELHLDQGRLERLGAEPMAPTSRQHLFHRSGGGSQPAGSDLPARPRQAGPQPRQGLLGPESSSSVGRAAPWRQRVRPARPCSPPTRSGPVASRHHRGGARFDARPRTRRASPNQHRPAPHRLAPGLEVDLRVLLADVDANLDRRGVRGLDLAERRAILREARPLFQKSTDFPTGSGAAQQLVGLRQGAFGVGDSAAVEQDHREVGQSQADTAVLTRLAPYRDGGAKVALRVVEPSEIAIDVGQVVENPALGVPVASPSLDGERFLERFARFVSSPRRRRDTPRAFRALRRTRTLLPRSR